MIIFNSITAKNFLSYGNSPTTIQLDFCKNTLIEGKNGEGKSSLISDAITYALFGKPYRAIKLSQLVNSINQRGLEVSIDFIIGSISYRVVRGLKPNKFEIYKDGVLVDQEAATRDYQGYLEKQVLKINYKTFVQVVILGTASFTPFMQLNTGQRREVIEDVLDISIFSSMNGILRGRINETKDELVSVGLMIDSAKKETILQQKLIKVIEEARENRIQEELDEISKINSNKNKLESDKLTLLSEIEDQKNNGPEPVDSKELGSLERIVSRLEDELLSSNKRLKNISILDECPTCLQCVSSEHINEVTAKLQTNITELGNNLTENNKLVEVMYQRMCEVSASSEIINKLTVRVKTLDLDISRCISYIEKHTATIESIKKNTRDILTEKEKLKSVAANAIKLIGQKTLLLEEKSIQEISQNLLKDSGIKAAIIKEYIPILNKLINKYLGIFGFFINFTLDENFVESIVSRGRDEFTYSSFSEGEKRRIDLSILFAFRQISEMKNSTNCNLLVCDEISESAFDLIARDAFMEILNGIDGGNNFVISHSAPSHDQYDRVLRAEKKNDFSVIREI